MLNFFLTVPKESDFDYIVSAMEEMEPRNLAARLLTISDRLEANRVNEMVRWHATGEHPSNFSLRFHDKDVSYRYGDVNTLLYHTICN